MTVEPLRVSMETMFDLEDNLLLFFTGFNRAAGGILKDQHMRSQARDAGHAAQSATTSRRWGIAARRPWSPAIWCDSAS